MQPLFSVEAPRYWEHGLPVIPLLPGHKRPILKNWPQYQDSMPSQATMDEWLSSYSNGNMGLPLGPQSGIMCIDIDTTDPKVEQAIKVVLPHSPWARVGKKGAMLAYKHNPLQKTVRIKDEHGATVVEILSAGAQIVMPPSIHPDTQMPYVANVHLCDVLKDLKKLPLDIEAQLRASLSTVIKLESAEAGKKPKITASGKVSKGGRDTAMNTYAGMLSRDVMRGEVSVKRALDLMLGWCKECAERDPNDPVDVDKGLSQVIMYVIKDVEQRNMVLPPGWDEDLTPEEKIQYHLEFSEESQEWTMSELNNYIFTELNGLDMSDPKRMQIVDTVLKRISKSQKLSEIEISAVLTNLKKNSGLNVPLSHYYKQLKTIQAGAIEGVNHTEIAEEVIKIYEERRNKLAFHAGEFWYYTGDCWRPADEPELRKVIAQEFGAMTAAKKSSDHKGILEIMTKIVPQKLSALEPKGVNFINGFLTMDLDLVDHVPEQGMTYVMPFAYNKELAGKCPMFFSFLHDCWGHMPDYHERVRVLQEMMAVTLFGIAPSFQKAFLLFGPGGSGKSVLLDIVAKLVPEEARSAVSPTEWGSDRFAVVDMVDKLLNRAGEIHESRRIDGETFKKIVCGEEMRVQNKNLRAYSASCKAAQWFASNWLPKSKDTSDGFNRRWLILTFDTPIPEEKRIVDLAQLIVNDEVEAIVAWAASILPELTESNKYSLPPSHYKAIEQMSLGNSGIRQWLKNRVIFMEGASANFEEMHRDYWSFHAATMGGKSHNLTEFRSELNQILMETQQLHTKAGNNGDIYLGFTLKSKQKA